MRIDGLTLIRWASLAFAAAGPIIAVIFVVEEMPGAAILAVCASIITTPLGMMSAAFAIPGTSHKVPTRR